MPGRYVALTFDDGPTKLSNKILDVLSKNGVKATFFWQGKNLFGKKEVITKAKKIGHQIANHSWDHTNGWNLDENIVWEQQVLRTIQELKNKLVFNLIITDLLLGELPKNKSIFLQVKELQRCFGL